MANARHMDVRPPIAAIVVTIVLALGCSPQLSRREGRPASAAPQTTAAPSAWPISDVSKNCAGPTTEAAVQLGMQLQEGKDVPKDEALAVVCFRRACDAGVL